MDFFLFGCFNWWLNACMYISGISYLKYGSSVHLHSNCPWKCMTRNPLGTDLVIILTHHLMPRKEVYFWLDRTYDPDRHVFYFPQSQSQPSMLKFERSLWVIIKLPCYSGLLRWTDIWLHTRYQCIVKGERTAMVSGNSCSKKMVNASTCVNVSINFQAASIGAWISVFYESTCVLWTFGSSEGHIIKELHQVQIFLPVQSTLLMLPRTRVDVEGA